MTPYDLEQLVRELGFNHIRVVNKTDDTNIMFCCPYHGERNPSCGISVDKLVGACFACGQTFTLAGFVAHVKGISIKTSKEWLEERFNIKRKTLGGKGKLLKRYDDIDVQDDVGKRLVLPRIELAPFKSGKVCHDYLLDRGFTKSTFKDFMLGWDTNKNRITIPLFWEDGELAGFIGRAVLEPKIDGKDNPAYYKVYGNEDKYHVYPELKKSKILYPLNRLVLTDQKEVNLVEGTLDAIKMHQKGFTNTLAILGSKISKEQIEILSRLGVLRINAFLDNDKAGFEGIEKLYTLGKKDFVVYKVNYPEGINDPAQLSSLQIEEMLKSRSLFGRKVLHNYL